MVYGEIAKVKNLKLGAFEPITESDLNDISKLALKFSKPLQYIIRNHPDLLLFHVNDNNTARLIFKTEAQSFFHIYANRLNMKNGLRPAPNLIWNVSINATQKTYNLELFAYKKLNKKSTTLYNVPFFNCSNYSVCLGSTKFDVEKNQISITDLIQAVVKGFFASVFTHSTTYKQSVSNLHELQNQLFEQKEFPLNELVVPDERGNILTLEKLLKKYGITN